MSAIWCVISKTIFYLKAMKVLREWPNFGKEMLFTLSAVKVENRVQRSSLHPSDSLAQHFVNHPGYPRCQRLLFISMLGQNDRLPNSPVTSSWLLLVVCLPGSSSLFTGLFVS